jgi:hypothetical protein
VGRLNLGGWLSFMPTLPCLESILSFSFTDLNLLTDAKHRNAGVRASKRIFPAASRFTSLSLLASPHPLTMAESSRLRSMESPYEDVEMKGASASATGVKTDADSFSDSQEAMENGDNDKRDMLRLGKSQEMKRRWGFWSGRSLAEYTDHACSG